MEMFEGQEDARLFGGLFLRVFIGLLAVGLRQLGRDHRSDSRNTGGGISANGEEGNNEAIE